MSTNKDDARGVQSGQHGQLLRDVGKGFAPNQRFTNQRFTNQRFAPFGGEYQVDGHGQHNNTSTSNKNQNRTSVDGTAGQPQQAPNYDQIFNNPLVFTIQKIDSLIFIADMVAKGEVCGNIDLILQNIRIKLVTLLNASRTNVLTQRAAAFIPSVTALIKMFDKGSGHQNLAEKFITAFAQSQEYSYLKGFAERIEFGDGPYGLLTALTTAVDTVNRAITNILTTNINGLASTVRENVLIMWNVCQNNYKINGIVGADVASLVAICNSYATANDPFGLATEFAGSATFARLRGFTEFDLLYEFSIYPPSSV
jgi:hypothetical protein